MFNSYDESQFNKSLLLLNDESLDNNNSYFNNHPDQSDNSFNFNDYEQNNNYNFLDFLEFQSKEEKIETHLNFEYRLQSPKNDELKIQQQNKIEIKSTAIKTLQTILTTNKEKIQTNKPINKEKIYELKIVEKNLLRRKRKNDTSINKEKTHTKMSKDNIMNRVKERLYNNSINFVNSQMENSTNEKIRNSKIRKIKNSVFIVSKREENIKFLNTTNKELFSNELSSKYKHPDKNSNIDIINYIYEQKEKNLIDFFNKTQKEILKIYCDDNVKKDFYENYKRLKEDLKDFKKVKKEEKKEEKEEKKEEKEEEKKEEKNEYIKAYEDYARNFEENITNIIPRKKRSKKLN